MKETVKWYANDLNKADDFINLDPFVNTFKHKTLRILKYKVQLFDTFKNKSLSIMQANQVYITVDTYVSNPNSMIMKDNVKWYTNALNKPCTDDFINLDPRINTFKNKILRILKYKVRRANYI